jgi:SRSO17 transposase
LSVRWAAVLDESPRPLLRRLMKWLTPFRECFGHEAQRISVGQYINGLLSDSARKSMQAMLARVTAPVRYQAFQHFITDAPWDAEAMWRILRRELPERAGVVIFDDTGFPKKGDHSVGVSRQYTGTLGKIGNCQVAVTATLWSGVRAWLIGAALYLPEDWFTDRARCEKARIPTTVVFQKKWELALGLLRDALAAGVDVVAVLADTGYGDVVAFRAALHELALAYAVGIASTTSVFRGTPQLTLPTRPARAHAKRQPRPTLAKGHTPIQVSALAAALPAKAWRRVTWRNGTHEPRAARFAACRVTPAHDWQRIVAPEVWLLCERSLDGTYDDKFFLIHLPPRTSRVHLVKLAHERWAIEQQYQQLKTELGLDHFEGRTYPGWNRHVALTAVAYAFLQRERIARIPAVTFETIRAIVQEMFTGLVFASHPRYLEWLADARELLPLRL